MNYEKEINRKKRLKAKQRYQQYKKNKRGKKVWIIVIISFLVLLSIGVGLYVHFQEEEIEQSEAEEGVLKIEKLEEESTVVDVDEGIILEDQEGNTSDVSQAVESYLSSMNLEARVGQLFMITPEELTGIGTVIQAGATTQEKLKEYPVGGLLFGDKNFEVLSQMQLMLTNIDAYTSIPIFLAIDEAGAERITNTNSTLEDAGIDILYVLPFLQMNFLSYN